MSDKKACVNADTCEGFDEACFSASESSCYAEPKWPAPERCELGGATFCCGLPRETKSFVENGHVDPPVALVTQRRGLLGLVKEREFHPGTNVLKSDDWNLPRIGKVIGWLFFAAYNAAALDQVVRIGLNPSNTPFVIAALASVVGAIGVNAMKSVTDRRNEMQFRGPIDPGVK